jgi:hypothetical protein
MEQNPDPGFGMNIQYDIFENFVSVFRLKILQFFGILSTLDPGSGMEKVGSRIRDKHNQQYCFN